MSIESELAELKAAIAKFETLRVWFFSQDAYMLLLISMSPQPIRDTKQVQLLLFVDGRELIAHPFR